ncbi:MAG: J domain-containing protein [Hyphomicrobiaceae bacterium]|nr:J domain-containing protein [Hyphomicrobiaceae bacterium]
MFERNRVDNFKQDRETAVPVELTFDDGRVVRGRFLVPSERPIYDVLNGSGHFMDFEPYGGDRELIAKSCLRAIRLMNVPKATGLADRGRSEDFNPFEVLGLERGADWPTIREAYHRLSKLYHPDRYAAAELPDEVLSYMATMARRLNAAYAALEEPHQVKREIARARTEPIYQRGTP